MIKGLGTSRAIISRGIISNDSIGVSVICMTYVPVSYVSYRRLSASPHLWVVDV